MEFMGYSCYGTLDIVLSISAVVASLALIIHPFLTLSRITLEMPIGILQPYPNIAMEVASLVWMVYAFPADGQAFTFHKVCLFGVNFYGALTHPFYIYFFLRYTTSWNALIFPSIKFGELLFVFGPFAVGHGSYFSYDSGDSEFLGPVSIIFGLMMYASPLPAIIDAYKKRHTETLPFDFCTLFFLHAVAWFSFAFFYPPTRDYYLVIAHGGGIILVVVQLLLCFVFNRKLQNSGATPEDSTPLLKDVP